MCWNSLIYADNVTCNESAPLVLLGGAHELFDARRFAALQ